MTLLPGRQAEVVLIRIVGTDLPGTSCGPSPERPDGHHGIRVAVQGRKGPGDLVGISAGDASTVTWDLACTVVRPPPDVDVRGPQIQGPPGGRFIYLSWGTNDGPDGFRMFRRAKLWLDAVPPSVWEVACDSGRLVGRLGLTDERGNPLCAAVRPPGIAWSAD